MPPLLPFRLLLLLYPPGFRERRGAALLALAKDALVRARRERGTAGALLAWGHALLDLLTNLPPAWRDALAGSRTRRPSPEPTMAFHPFESLSLDARLGLRRLARTRGFTAAAVLTLGAALAAVTAVFSLVDQVVLRPLPYPHADRLVSLWESRDGRDISVAWPNFEDWRARLGSFEELAVYTRKSVTLTGRGDAARLRGLAVTGNLFRTTGVEPALGRFFGPTADRPGATPEVVLTDALWTERFGRDPSAVGTTLALDGVPHLIVGVAPAGFRFPDGIVLASSDLFVPLGAALDAETMANRGSHPGLYALGRLREGTDLERAQAELAALTEALTAEFPSENRGYGIRSASALDSVVGDAGAVLLLVGIAVGMVLLVAGANVSALFLARGWAREDDTTVQLALGAGRIRLARQVLVESLAVGLAAAALGVGGAWLALEAAAPVLAELPRAPAARIDLRVAAFAVVAAVATAVLVGILPALRPGGGRDAPGARRVLGTRREGRLRDALVAAEVALAVVLLVGATLLVRSLSAVRSMETGVLVEGVLTFTVGLPADPYEEPGRASAFFEALSAEVAALPGVVGVGGVSTLPFSGAGSQSGVRLPSEAEDAARTTDVQVALPDYFPTMGIELVRGRLPDEADREGDGTVAVVDERFARSFFGDEDPLGRTVQGWGFPAIEIVGVVEDVTHYGVLGPSRETLYVPHAQRPYTRMQVVVRTEAGDPLDLVPALRARLASLDPDVPLADPAALTDRVQATLATPRTAATLGSLMAALGALLSLVGVQALVAYAVSRRTREIGVRMALGAPGRQVRTSLLLRALRPALAGIALGLVLALAATRGLAAWVYGFPLLDPLSFGVAGGVLLTVVVLAGALPARRIARIDPVRALRAE